jgi:hypothetical protein
LRGSFFFALKGARFAPLAPNTHVMLLADRNGASAVVDIFNATSGIWSTAALIDKRLLFAATSLPDQGLAIFAGGYTGMHVCRDL